MGSWLSSAAVPTLEGKKFVFLSHTDEGHDLAHAMFLAIKERHNDFTYWDMSKIPPAAGTAGTPAFNAHIDQLIDACEFMVGVCDAKCKDSHVTWGSPAEWEMARRRGKFVIIVAVAADWDIAKENHQVRSFAKHVQFIKYQPCTRTDVREMVAQEATKFLSPSSVLQPMACPIVAGEPFVFLSHTDSGHDLAHAMFLAIKEQFPHLTYWDTSRIPPAAGTAGTASSSTLTDQAIDACKFMLAVCDAECSHIERVPAEWDMARRKGKLVLVVAIAVDLDVAKQNREISDFAERVKFIQYDPDTRIAVRGGVVQRVAEFLAATSTPKPIPPEIVTLCLEGDLSAFTDDVEYRLKSSFVTELALSMRIEHVRIIKNEPSRKLAARIGTNKCRIRVEIDKEGFAQYTSDDSPRSSGSNSDTPSPEDEIEEALQTAISLKFWPSRITVADIQTVWKRGGSVLVALSLPSPVAHVVFQLAKQREEWLIKNGVRCCKFLDDIVCLDAREDIAEKARRLCNVSVDTIPCTRRSSRTCLCCGRDESDDVISANQLMQAPPFVPGNLVFGYNDPTPEKLLEAPSFEPGGVRTGAGSDT